MRFPFELYISVSLAVIWLAIGVFLSGCTYKRGVDAGIEARMAYENGEKLKGYCGGWYEGYVLQDYVIKWFGYMKNQDELNRKNEQDKIDKSY